MKYTVRIDDVEYEVEITDLRARPIIAIVNGTPVEVLPANTHSTTHAPAAAKSTIQAPRLPSDAGAVFVRAPIPGVIQEILVKPGQSVEQAQALFIIEAMKMKNTIRSPRSGVIADVLAAPGTTVNHNAPIISFAEG
jgi:biotin carboxyl carrier protein